MIEASRFIQELDGSEDVCMSSYLEREAGRAKFLKGVFKKKSK